MISFKSFAAILIPMVMNHCGQVTGQNLRHAETSDDWLDHIELTDVQERSDSISRELIAHEMSPSHGRRLMDSNLLMKESVYAAVKKIPVVGSILGVMVEVFWKVDGPSVWADVEDQVNAAISDALQRQEADDFISAIKALHDGIEQYDHWVNEGWLWGQSRELHILRKDCREIFRDFIDTEGKDEEILKQRYYTLHIAALFAPLHLSILREYYLYGHLFEEGRPADDTSDIEMLEEYATNYTAHFSRLGDPEGEWMQWRRTLMKPAKVTKAIATGGAAATLYLDTWRMEDKLGVFPLWVSGGLPKALTAEEHREKVWIPYEKIRLESMVGELMAINETITANLPVKRCGRGEVAKKLMPSGVEVCVTAKQDDFEECTFSSQCSSGNCINQICSPVDWHLGAPGETCVDDLDCLSNFCYQGNGPVPNPICKLDVGHSCDATQPNQCITGHCNSLGFCEAKAFNGHFCMTNSDCYSGRCNYSQCVPSDFGKRCKKSSECQHECGGPNLSRKSCMQSTRKIADGQRCNDNQPCLSSNCARRKTYRFCAAPARIL